MRIIIIVVISVMIIIVVIVIIVIIMIIIIIMIVVIVLGSGPPGTSLFCERSRPYSSPSSSCDMWVFIHMGDYRYG